MISPISFSDTLGLAGIAISVLFGIWGVYLAVRRAKYPAKLTFVREQSVALLADFAAKLPNLSLLYKNTPVNKSVVLISGHVVNDGNVDISPGMVERPLTCSVPDACSWLEFRVTTTADALKVSPEISSASDVALKLGLFRRDESFAFQALVLLDDKHAGSKPTAFAEELRWSHRIAGLGGVKTILMPNPDRRPKTVRIFRGAAFALMAGFYAFFGISQVFSVGPLASIPAIVYEYQGGNQKSTLRLLPNRDGTTTLHDINSGTEKDVNLAAFTKTGTFVPKWIPRRGPDKAMAFFGAMTLLASLYVLFTGFWKDVRRYRIRRLVFKKK